MATTKVIDSAIYEVHTNVVPLVGLQINIEVFEELRKPEH